MSKETKVYSGRINGAWVEVSKLESWRGSFYHATATKNGQTAVNTNHDDPSAAAKTAAECVDIKISAAETREKERWVRNHFGDENQKPIKHKGITQEEDDAFYKENFTNSNGLPPRPELSAEAKAFGIKAVLIFVLLFLLLAGFISLLPN